MIRRFGFLCAALAGVGFGKDVFQPVKRGALEFGAGTGYSQGFGKYDAEGDFLSWKDQGRAEGYSPAAYGATFSSKYGLGGGVDLKADWAVAFTNLDAGNLKGMTQPGIGIKYTGTRGGLFTNLTLPYAPGDFDNGDLSTVVEVGGLLRKRLQHFRVTGLVSYYDDFRVDRAAHLTVGRLSLQPEILWKRGLSTYFKLEYLKAFNKNGDILTLTPGLRADISSNVSCDVGVGTTLGGHNAPAAWGFKASLSWTLLR